MSEPRQAGALVLFARHPTAANLVLLLMIVSGLIALTRLNRQFFPDFGIDVISVSVAWPGASAEDVEESILAGIEPELRFLDGVKKVIGIAEEGRGTFSVEFRPRSDMQKALADVEQAVGRVTTLPEASETPKVRRIIRYDTVSRLVLSGDVDEAVLKVWAKKLRDDLLARGVDRVTLFGARSERIEVTVPPVILRQLDLGLADIGRVIARSSQDVPSGALETELKKQPRTMGLARTAAEVAAIDLVARPDGRRLRVGDVATVTEDFDPDEPVARRSGRPAIELHVQRSADVDALGIDAKIASFLNETAESLPAEITLERFDRLSSFIEDRIRLLLVNGASGLTIVCLLLFLFLNARVAFWVAVGIPASLLAMLALLWLNGQSINMISLFAMILAVGIVVDDAIVVGEHASSLNDAGMPAATAAELAATRMFWPVASATLTTVAAFSPLLMIGDIIGTIIREIPIVVIMVLTASLVECFLCLPHHLARALVSDPGRVVGWRARFNRGFEAFRQGPLRWLVVRAVVWRYTTLALALATLLMVIGLLETGRVGFVFFSGPEADRIDLNLALPPGTRREVTEQALQRTEQALLQAERDLGGAPGSLVQMILVRVGRGAAESNGQPVPIGDEVGRIDVELVPSDHRPVRTAALIEAWRARIPAIAGVDKLTIRERQGGPPGREVDIRLSGALDIRVLKDAAIAVREMLAALPSVHQIDDDLDDGKPEILIELTPRGRAIGFTTESVGAQVRNALQGHIAKRFARGEEEVEIVVRLDEAARRQLDLRRLSLRAPNNSEVALAEVATLRERSSFARITREAGQRQVAVTAEIDEAGIRLEQVQEAMIPKLEELAARTGLGWRFAGRADEQAQTLGDLRIGTFAALFAIYVILAWVFGKFGQPLVVMIVIPFGLVGAVLGHLVMGYDLNILSFVALLGLSGILVNDSIVLVDQFNDLLRQGMDAHDAAIESSVARFRAVLLTSTTTIGGLSTLLLETSFQAQFLIPMAITLCFGLAVSTLLVLLIVPAMLGVAADLEALVKARSRASDARGVAVARQ